MAIINKTGITNGGTIQAEHITRAIDALSGVGTDSIIASGSFTGALTGTASFATTASFALNASGTGFPFTGSARITGSLIVTGSITNRNGNLNILGNSHTISGSNEILIDSPAIRIEDKTGTTLLGIIATLSDTSIITGGAPSEVDLTELGNASSGKFVVPIYETNSPKAGTMYWDDTNSVLKIYSDTLSKWVSSSFA